jgi:hydrogenase/urease accessory protein HupE
VERIRVTDHCIGPARALLAVAFGLALASMASPAEAHLITTGLGPVYDGISHFALTAEDLVPVLALALFSGLRGKEHGRRVLIVLPAAWLLGGIVGLVARWPVNASLAWVSLALVGGLVATDLKLSLALTTALAVMLGLFHGFQNGATMAQDGPGVLGVIGTAASVFVAITLAAAFVVTLRAGWSRIAVRVAGSWIAASGLLLLGWSLRS